jgi:beta-galactosidase
VEEFDALPEPFRRQVRPLAGGEHGLSGSYEARHYLDVAHLEGAEAFAVYGEDFYEGYPALTRNRFGKGEAWHIASRNEDRFTNDFLRFLARRLKLPRAIEEDLPSGVTAHVRVKENQRFLFVLNFKGEAARVDLGKRRYLDAESNEVVEGSLDLLSYGSRILIASG